MPNQAMTVTPDGFVSEETGEFVQTGHVIEGSAMGEQQRTNELREQAERFVEDEDGNTHYDNDMTDSDYDALISNYGGETVYNEVSSWAADNFSQEDIDGYNSIVERGDLTEIAEAMETVFQHYNNRNEDSSAPTPETDANAVDWVFNELISENDYQQLVEFARTNMDDEFIDNYNMVMESGDRNMIQKTIELLRNKVNEI